MPHALSIVLCALARRSVVVIHEDTPSNDKFTLYDCMSHNVKLEYKLGSPGNSNRQVPGSIAHKFAVFLCSRKKNVGKILRILQLSFLRSLPFPA